MEGYEGPFNCFANLHGTSFLVSELDDMYHIEYFTPTKGKRKQKQKLSV